MTSGASIVFTLFALQLAASLLGRSYDQIARTLSVNVKPSCGSTGRARIEFDQGRIVNLVNVDVEQFAQVILESHNFWVVPLQVAVTVVLLHNLIGNAVFYSFAVLAGALVIQTILLGPFGEGQKKLLSASDARLKAIRELLYAIRAVKLHAWENLFHRRITALRDQQIAALRILSVTVVVFIALSQLAPTLMPIVGFIVWVKKFAAAQVLDPAVIFPALSLYQILTEPLFQLPQIAGDVVQIAVSYGRIRSFLIASEVEPLALLPSTSSVSPQVHVTDVESQEYAISIRNATFKWEAVEPFFRNLNLHIPKGKLTIVVGPVGSGKSSLLSAIIGEMTLVDDGPGAGAAVAIAGRVAYAPQQPWILTETVEGNIHRSARTRRAAEAAMLDADLSTLSAGLRTLIGEKGVNLSGGQQARIGLARAVYDDADVYLLDDPLAALDAHVGAAVFDRPVVLVTHQLHLLPVADNVVVLDKGVVAQTGRYQELIAAGSGALVEMMRGYAGGSADGGRGSGKEASEKLGGEDEVTAETPGAQETKATESEGDDKDILDEEDRAVGTVSGRVWLGFFKACGGAALVIAVLLLAAGQQAASVIGSQVAFAISADEYIKVYAILRGRPVVWIGLLVAGVYFASIHYHKAALTRLLRAPMSFFESQPIGRILNRFSKDISVLDEHMWPIYYLLVLNATALLGSLGLIIANFPVILALVVPLGGIYYVLMLFYRSSKRELKRLDSIQRSPLNAHISETLAGIPSVRAYKAETHFIERQRLLTDLSNAPNYLYNCTAIWISLRIEILAALLTLVIASLGVSGKVDSSSIGLTLTYALGVIDSVGMLIKAFAEVESEMNSIERLDYYGKYIPVEALAELPSDPDASWPSEGAIEISNLEVRYPSRPDHPVIKDFSISVRPGEKIGVVGRTGSGKSTLLTVIFRLVEPTAGTIRIDGVNILEMGLSSLRSRLQIITQEPTLFSGTVRSNLDVEAKHSDAEVWDVLEMIGMKEYVAELPEKLDSPVAEGGTNLSVGQRQLVCLGRAILDKSKLLFLDEATASVDAAADQLIQQSLRTHFSSATVVSIAHRLNTIVSFDRVLVLDRGDIVEFDSPDVLLNKPRGDGALLHTSVRFACFKSASAAPPPPAAGATFSLSSLLMASSPSPQAVGAQQLALEFLDLRGDALQQCGRRADPLKRPGIALRTLAKPEQELVVLEKGGAVGDSDNSDADILAGAVEERLDIVGDG
ncbi:P-loop containing nucleoside triphosphate hydrolase protein [Zopfochytrium polystomum]|nr:P-loop containing nucleoside triphosphate hydrolase protein [Zopfochytrium polystomum]